MASTASTTRLRDAIDAVHYVFFKLSGVPACGSSSRRAANLGLPIWIGK